MTCTSLIRLSKCVTTAGLRGGPAWGWLYDLRASEWARVQQILGFSGGGRPLPDRPAGGPNGPGRESAAEHLRAGRIKQLSVACERLPACQPLHQAGRGGQLGL